mgnify:CR=1 FL=1
MKRNSLVALVSAGSLLAGCCQREYALPQHCIFDNRVQIVNDFSSIYEDREYGEMQEMFYRNAVSRESSPSEEAQMFLKEFFNITQDTASAFATEQIKVYRGAIELSEVEAFSRYAGILVLGLFEKKINNTLQIRNTLQRLEEMHIEIDPLSKEKIKEKYTEIREKLEN